MPWVVFDLQPSLEVDVIMTSRHGLYVKLILFLVQSMVLPIPFRSNFMDCFRDVGDCFYQGYILVLFVFAINSFW